MIKWISVIDIYKKVYICILSDIVLKNKKDNCEYYTLCLLSYLSLDGVGFFPPNKGQHWM